VQIAIQIFQALEHAHHFGVVHRDLKPENVFLTTDFRGQEVVKLVDFGIAKLIDEQGAQEKLTRAGVVFGTPRYMSPEQAAGGKVDERSDLYTAGLILYEMLCGHVPFEADDLAQVLRMQIIAPPPALPPSVPLALVEIVENLLEKSKSDRRASAREVLDVLVPLERELTPSPPPPAALPMAPTFPEMPVAADVARGAPTFGSSAAAPTIPHIPLSRSGPTTSSLVVVPSRDDPRKRWRPWLIAAGAMFLVLMFIGAVVSSGEDDTGSNAAPGSFTTQPADEAREEEDDWEHEQNKKRKKKREKDREKEKKHWEIKWQ
jgi:serine/threonine protein kinase